MSLSLKSPFCCQLVNSLLFRPGTKFGLFRRGGIRDFLVVKKHLNLVASHIFNELVIEDSGSLSEFVNKFEGQIKVFRPSSK
ncbi:hypothetical protein FKM82_020832 [Ascaphus truei]